VFDLSRIAASGLVARTDYHESLGSTSDRALALAAEGAADLPLLVLTERQTAGRGRGTNRWWATEGALTFSLLLEAPNDRLPPVRWPQVALTAGLAVCEGLSSFVPAADLRVKWPNDVYLAGRKVAGILSESAAGLRDRLVVGIGINVNNRGQATGEGHSEASAAPPIAVADHDGVPRNLTSVLLEVLDQWDRRWQELLADQFSEIASAYRRRCFLTSKTVAIEQAGGAQLVGVCRGIDSSGALRLQCEFGDQTVISGSVQRWDN
jgi:BirA family biotin operon repressor/biotin-[acetyl-CoA-carboxylase] ligase